jgi:guanine deaminase
MLTSDDSSSSDRRGFRAAILDFVEDPFYVTETECARYFSDGLLVLEAGKVLALGHYEDLIQAYAEIPIVTYPNQLILPGFIDTHIHFPQTEMIAAYGEQLLQWLSSYTFPIERKFSDYDYALKVANVFLDELLRNGTTTALVFAAVFPASVEALFTAAIERNLRLIAGKVMMDRNAPDFLLDTAESAYEDSKRLIQKWHDRGRLAYAVTPRFAVTSSEAQLEVARRLMAEFPSVYLQTHLSENLAEIELVQQLFPDCEGYLDIYDRAGLVGDRSVFAHCIHLTDAEFQRLSAAGSAIACCPTSNLFLGSGLFKFEQAKSRQHPVEVGLGTDIGAGTSFSLLQTANEAYKVAQLRQQKLSPFQALFLATLGGARALGLENKIGNFDPGKEADFIVLDRRSTPLMAFRNPVESPTSLSALADQLFSLIILGDDRAVAATYIMGELAYPRSHPPTAKTAAS